MYPPTKAQGAAQRRTRVDASILDVATDHHETPVPATFLAR